MFANFILPELDHKCSEVFEFEISENEAIKQSIRLPGSKTEKNLKTSCVFKTQTSIEEVLICKKERQRIWSFVSQPDNSDSALSV